MDKVWMTHPNLPGQLIEVFRSAVPVHEVSGWVVDGSAAQPGPEAEPEAADLPAKNAAKSDRQDAARAAGMTDDEIAGKTRDELINHLTGNQE